MKEQVFKTMDSLGFSWMIPLTKLITMDEPKKQLQVIANGVFLPFLAIVLFLSMWSVVSANIQTSLGQLPGPTQVWQQGLNLVDEHFAEQDKKVAFLERQDVRNAKKLAANPDAKIRTRVYTGPPTFIDQIFTSLITVITGFLVASFIAIPLGILCGLSNKLNSALNPIFQIFKPISPLAWLPIVTMVVSAVYVSDDPLFAKSFVEIGRASCRERV